MKGEDQVSQGEKDIQVTRKAKNPKLSKPPPPAYRGLKPGWKRATLIIRETHLFKIKDVAYWERKEIKEVVDEALGAYLKTKEVKSRPLKKED
jgi:hypothetical protein